MDHTQTIDALIRENFILKAKVDKLTAELSIQLEDHAEHIHGTMEKVKVSKETAHINRLLLSVGKILEERYRVMAENIDEIVSIVDLKGKFIFLNQNAADLHGFRIKEMIGKSVFDLMEGHLNKNYRSEIFDLIVKQNRRILLNAVFSKGDYNIHLEFHCQPIHDDAGDLIGILNIAHDRTADKKKANYIAIEHSINLITSFSDGMEKTIQDIFFKLCQAECIYAGGLYLFAREKRSLELVCHYNLTDSFVNKVNSLDTSTPQFEIVARGIPQYKTSPELAETQELDIFKTGNKTIAVIPLIHEKEIVGALNFILAVPEQLTAGDKLFLETIAWRIARIIGLHESQLILNRTVAELNETISDLKIKQQILIQKSKMESLGELSAGMAHEINQPLVIISLSIENIRQKMSLGKKNLSTAYLQRKFDSILLNVNRIQQIIDNMRIFARDQSNIIFTKVNIGELITKTMEMVSVQYRAEGIKIICDVVDVDAHVIGNFFKLEQVLLNLLSNSRYALHEKFSKADKAGQQKQIEIRAVRAGNVLHLEVFDNGIGINEENLEKLFTPFFTTKMEGAGTGLGLPIVYGIVQEMNGEINVASKANEFTNVKITLPVV